MPELYHFYVFRGNGERIFFRCLARDRGAEGSAPPDAPGPAAVSREPVPMLAGLLYALKRCATAIGGFEGSRLEYFDTEAYRCHFFETGTGYWLAILSSPDTHLLQQELFYVYKEIFVRHAVENPLWEPGTDMSGLARFSSELDAYLSTLKL